MKKTFLRFQNELLVGAYSLAERKGTELVEVGEILDSYPISYREQWIMRALFDFRDGGLISDGITHDPPLTQSFWLTAGGMKEAERLIDQGCELAHKDEFADVSEVSGRIFSGEGPAPANLLRDGDIYLELAPASDRIVRLDHNSNIHQEVTDGIASVLEQAEATNSFGASAEERDRLIVGLKSAKELWASSQLKVAQIKIGILLALQDAHAAFRAVGKTIRIELIFSLIKRLIKDETGIDI